MTTLQRLNLSYYRATSPERRAELLAEIDALLAKTTCHACGEPIGDGGSCWSGRCYEGRENITVWLGDAAYHSRIDREMELAHDL